MRDWHRGNGTEASSCESELCQGLLAVLMSSLMSGEQCQKLALKPIGQRERDACHAQTWTESRGRRNASLFPTIIRGHC